MSGVVVIGGTSGIGREFARVRAERGDEVVITGRDAQRTDTAAKEIGARGSPWTSRGRRGSPTHWARWGPSTTW